MILNKFITLLSLMPFLIFNYAKANNETIAEKNDYVVVLHGIARSSKHMESLAKYLEKNRFHVLNINYPSTNYKIEELATIVHNDISDKIRGAKTVHFVGYSMGGLIVRALLQKYSYPNLSRVVHLGTPNHGSEVADFLKDNWIYKKIYGPAGQQLITDSKATSGLFGEVNYELGIIAGDGTIDPVSSMIISGKDDGKVAVERTKLKGMKDHITINVSHTFFPSNKKVQMQTLYFLNHGQFQHNT